MNDPTILISLSRVTSGRLLIALTIPSVDYKSIILDVTLI